MDEDIGQIDQKYYKGKSQIKEPDSIEATNGCLMAIAGFVTIVSFFTLLVFLFRPD